MSTTTSTTIHGVTPSIHIKKQAMSHVITRYGFGYPLTKNLNAGYFSKATGKELVRNNLTQLLTTSLGERIMLPGYGINLRKYLFQPMDEMLFKSIKEDILEAIAKYANNVKVLKLGVYPLNEYGAEGLQAMQIKLSVRIKENENTTFEVGVKIG